MSAHAYLDFIKHLRDPYLDAAGLPSPLPLMLDIWTIFTRAPASTQDTIVQREDAHTLSFVHYQINPTTQRANISYHYATGDHQTLHHALRGIAAYAHDNTGIPPYDPTWEQQPLDLALFTPDWRVRGHIDTTEADEPKALLAQFRHLPINRSPDAP